MTTTPEKYAYQISFSTLAGIGSFTALFGKPITRQDVPELERMIRQSGGPGAILLGFSLFAPERKEGEPVEVPVKASDFNKVLRSLRNANERIKAMAEEIETLKREAGLLP